MIRVNRFSNFKIFKPLQKNFGLSSTKSSKNYGHISISTCKKSSLSLNQEDLHVHAKENKQIMLEKESHKPEQKLNFPSLVKYKRSVGFNVITEIPEKKARMKVDLDSMKKELEVLRDPPQTLWEKQISSSRLPFSFYNVPSQTLAKNMLGKVLVRKLENGVILKGRIVETESYLGVEDKASHTYGGKVTQRNIPMYLPPGTIYIYFTYGMYHCFNVSSKESNQFVQIKKLEVITNLEFMELLKNTKKKIDTKKIDLKRDTKKIDKTEVYKGAIEICNTFEIFKDDFDGKNICQTDNLWIE